MIFNRDLFLEICQHLKYHEIIAFSCCNRYTTDLAQDSVIQDLIHDAWILHLAYLEVDSLLIKMSKLDQLSVVKKLISSFTFNSKVLYSALSTACLAEQIEIVDYYLDELKVDPSVDNSRLLIKVCEKVRHYFTLEKIINHPQIDPTAQEGEALIVASRAGNYSAVELLLKIPKVRYAINDNRAIRAAYDHCNRRIVKLLYYNFNVEQHLTQTEKQRYHEYIYDW